MRLRTSPAVWRSVKRLKKTGTFSASPPLVLTGGFVILILLGALLLSLPIATIQPISFFTALFTATSAVTTTGLTLVPVDATFTHFGEIVLALLVQIGGLGFVTLAVVAVLTLRKRMALSHQVVALQAFNQTSVSKIRDTALTVLKMSVAIELVAVILLTLWWLPETNVLTALYRALFHVVSAFNNTGFTLDSTSLTRYISDPASILITTFLIILGGLGFSVLSDIHQKRNWWRLAVYTRIVLLGTLALNVLGFVMIWALEFRNPETLGPLGSGTQALNAWMQSVTARTAGFSTIDISQLRDSTSFLLILLMFIGGGSLSTASGIKVGTFIVLLAAAYSYIRGRSEITLLRRSVPSDVVRKSLALLLVTSGLAFTAVFLLTIFEDKPFLDLLFEVISALSTTGLSRNVTATLSMPSQILLIILMFVGRLGPLTLVYSLSTQGRSRIRYPEAQFQVG